MARAPRRHPRHNARFALTSRGWGLLIVVILLFVSATSLGSVQLMAAGLLLAALLPFGVLIALWPIGSVRVERVHPISTLTADDRMHIRVRLDGPGARRVAVSDWHDLLPSALPRDELVPETPTTRVVLPGGGSAYTGGTTVRAQRRGVHTLGPVEALIGDPFGLVRVRRHFGGTDQITVLPRPATHVPFGGLRTQGADGQAGRVSRRGESGLDDPIPRAYRPGDSIRRVNWRASARHGELMVRQEESTPSPTLYVVLDTDAEHWFSPPARASFEPMYEWAAGARDGYDPLFEWAVSLAATASIDAAAHGWRPVLCTGGSVVTTRGRETTSASAESALLALARAEPSAHSVPVSALHSTLSRRHAVIAVLGRVTPAVAAEYAALCAKIDSGTALLVADLPIETRSILETAGWVCVDMPSPEPVRLPREGAKR